MAIDDKDLKEAPEEKNSPVKSESKNSGGCGCGCIPLVKTK